MAFFPGMGRHRAGVLCHPGAGASQCELQVDTVTRAAAPRADLVFVKKPLWPCPPGMVAGQALTL